MVTQLKNVKFFNKIYNCAIYLTLILSTFLIIGTQLLIMG
ncbi:hypothetical protein ATW7_15076 [Alteromonadales bacterium TW-7]|nr:hypothetical protein ATW7_15076 [Alteromonadales bacterium TW-7]